MSYQEPFVVDVGKAMTLCGLVKSEVDEQPGWEFEQSQEASCWASISGWSVFFSWGQSPADQNSNLICQLMRRDFRDAFLKSDDLNYQAALFWTSASCLSITGHLLDEIDVASSENLRERISRLLRILGGKGNEGLQDAWEQARNFEGKFWARYLEIPWIENP